MSHRIVFGDNLPVLAGMPDNAFDLIYIDPPFNTGRARALTQLRATRSETGRVGFQGRRYQTSVVGTQQYEDAYDDYLAFLEPRLRQAHRVLADTGTLYFHIDFREVHYCKVLLDRIFGRESFLNEVIWAYDFGGRTRNRWPPKHDNILVYVKDPRRYLFNYGEMERIPYMSPGLAGATKAALGKTPTDTWWHTIVPTAGSEKTGYPTQKPLGILRRVVRVSSPPGGKVLDFFAGSGTTGAACLELGRDFTLVDNNPQALEVMARRFAGVADIEWCGWDTAGKTGE